MKRGHFLGRAVAIFAVVLIGYMVVFKWIEHRRVAKGPWDITFAAESGVPKIIVNHSQLGIRDVRVVFSNEHVATNMVQKFDFSQGRPVPFDVPFGQCVFLDTLFLPGTVALRIFNHEVQFMPRGLTVDKAERPWRSGEIIELRKTDSSPR